MKSVSAKIFVATIVIAVIGVGVAFMLGMEAFKMKHKCAVDKATGRATCTA